MTTNFDDPMERAFRDAREEFDLVSYVAEGEGRGKFLHLPPDGEARLIEPAERVPGAFAGGAVGDPEDPRRRGPAPTPRVDSFVITEDHYIDYLTRTDMSTLVPVTLGANCATVTSFSSGYSLRDWNLRVILHRIWGEQKLTLQVVGHSDRVPKPIDQGVLEEARRRHHRHETSSIT